MAGSSSPPSLALRPVLAIAACLVALDLAVAGRYGFHRDELYFLACARHLAWGYVDQPPLVPAVARLSTALFGSSVVGLRLFPALAGGAAVVITALMARELGGGRRAQAFAALAAATSGQVFATFHLLSTAAFDLLFWAAITLLVVRLLRTGNARLWLAVGVVAGVGMLNKWNVAFLVAAIGVGLIASGRSGAVRSRWLWAGVGVALLIWSPNIFWNAQHHWAAVTMLHSLHTENSTLSASITFIPGQLIIVGPALLPVWLGGLRRLWRGGWARPLGVAYVVLVALDVVTGAKAYYLGGIYFVLFAAGGIWVDQRIAARGHGAAAGGAAARGRGAAAGGAAVRSAAVRWAAWMTVGTAIFVPLALPVLPVTTLPSGDWESKINKDLSATVGWKRVVAQVAAVASGLPPAQRATVVIFTGDYGAAGAVDLYGARFGLPHAISGHNNYWLWGPAGAADGATTIAINLDRSYLDTIFGQVVAAGTVDTGHGVWTEERGEPIWICRDQKVTWARAWPQAKHYG